ncbi:LacI family DNA-binding transcriptional regulator [Isoptericola variabilis]|uniref:LacI family DNA-binding transcriptional regulator n=1 Tax=Isoptericola variabilis TaxID=139208 RepID=UPI003D22312A
MRAAGSTAAGGVVGLAPLALPTGRSDVDLDAVRERREAEKARRAATNPFAQPSGQPRSMSASRALAGALVDTEYEKAAFTTPPPAPIASEEVPVPTPKPTFETFEKPAPRRGPRPGQSKASREIRNRQIVALYVSADEVLTMQDVADRVGVSLSTVSNVLKAAGVEVRRRQAAKPTPPSKIAERLAARPDAAPAPAPRPSVRRVRTLDGELGRGFIWTCPGHKAGVQLCIKVTFKVAVEDLDEHLRKEHSKEAAA